MGLACQSKMVLEQSPKPPQFPDGLVVRSGDDGPAAEEQPPHVFRDGNVCNGGLPLQLFIFGSGYSHGAPALEFRGVSAVFLHAFPPLSSEKRSAERDGVSKGACPLAGWCSWLAASYQPVNSNCQWKAKYR